MSEETKDHLFFYLNKLSQIVQILVLVIVIPAGNAIVDLKQEVTQINTRMELLIDINRRVNALEVEQKNREVNISRFYKEYAPALEWAKRQSQKDDK